MEYKISVFGATGFVGSRFCEMFPHSVVSVNRCDYEPKSNEILYLISTTDNYNIHDDLHIDIDTNLKVLMNVLENVKKNPDATFNFVSSWFVYGKTDQMPFDENGLCKPTGFYSITKHAAEQMLICFCNTFDIKYRIFRLSNVLGENDTKFSKKKNALQFLINELVHNRNISLYDDGNIVRDYLYVDDVCDAIKLCIDKAPVNEIINIGAGKPVLFKHAIEHAIKASASTSKVEKMEPTEFHKIVQTKNAYLNIEKLKSYGFSQKYSIEHAIEKIVNYYKLTTNNQSL